MRYLKYIILILALVTFLGWVLILRIEVKPINNPDIFIIESWLPPTYLEQASNYILENKIDSVWLVGMTPANLSDSQSKRKRRTALPTALVWNGYIRANFDSNILSDTLLVDVEGYKAFGIGAFILIYINDELVGSTIIDGRDTLKIPSEGVSNLTLVFGNDTRCKRGEDRNLKVYSISGLSDTATVEEGHGGVNTLPDRLELTMGLKTQIYLQQLGCNASHFSRIEGTPKGNNYTLQSSLLFRKWLSENYKESKRLRVNIFTTSQHAKRTYINYKNALKDFADVGVISCESQVQRCEGFTRKQKFLAWLDETSSTIITKLYWLFH